MTHSSDNLRASVFMMLAMAAFTLNDACMKALSDELPLFQAVFLRGLATSGLMIVVAAAMGGLRFSLTRRDWVLVGVRAGAEIAAAYFFISALFNMPIANATAILQALPLTVTLAGAVFLGEAVGWRRLSAILIGFCGVLLIIQPGGTGFNSYSIYAALAVLSVTVRDLAARRVSRRVPSVTVALIAAVAVTVAAGLASISDDWVRPSVLGWAQLAGSSVSILGGYVFSVMTMRIGDIAAVTPFRYTSLLWALLFGYFIFGEWPDVITLFGAAVVVGTGIFTLMREHVLAQRASRATAPPG